MKKVFLLSASLSIAAILYSELQAQNQDAYFVNNLARIAEIATPEGVLPNYHTLIGYEPAGFLKQASAMSTYKVFGLYPNTSHLNPTEGSGGFNYNHLSGVCSGSDCYEVRYGDDSSRYWIGTKPAKNRLPFSVYNVGPRSALTPSVTGGTKLLISVIDKNNDSIYNPGETVFVFGDYALPQDTTYQVWADSSRRPFGYANCLLTNFRTGRDTISYSSAIFDVSAHGILPPSGTVIRFVSKQADTTKPFVYPPDTVKALSARRFVYPLKYYSIIPHTYELSDSPAGMHVSGDTLIWDVDTSDLGHSFAVTLQISNELGNDQKTFVASAERLDGRIESMCKDMSRDTIEQNMIHLIAYGSRQATQSNRRNIAEWIRARFLDYGYQDAELDSFTVSASPFLGWQYNVIATLQGSVHPDSLYITGAHYDSYVFSGVGAPGADDNASGTAAIMEIARIIKKGHYLPSNTIRFIAFAAEEYGLYGSEAYAAKAKAQNMRIQCMVNHDVIGYCPDSSTMWKNRFIYYPNSTRETLDAMRALLTYTTLDYIWDSTYAINSNDAYSFYQQGYHVFRYREYQTSPFWHYSGDILSTCNIPYITEMSRASMAYLLSKDQGTYVSVPEPVQTRPVSFVLFQNYPNPFNPSTTIRYQLALNAKVTVKIYNTLGQEVATLVNKRESAGMHAVQWNGRNQNGSAVASGVYMYRIEAVSEKGRFAETKKMVYLK